jgi:hypothetical protein
VNQYVFIRKNGQPSGTSGLARTMGAAGLRITPGGGRYQLIQNEGKMGVKRSAFDMLTHLRDRLRMSSVGDRFQVVDSEGNKVFKVHNVEPALQVIDINGNDRADLYYSTILATFPQFAPRYAGCYVCKDVAGSSTPSQHSYGNAVDFFFASLNDQDQVALWVVANADALNVEHAISRNRIWTRGEGWHTYTGDYHSHLHVDFNPQFSGPCGVRG